MGSRQVVGRLAPSPTGAQHIGNARSYLIAWLSARSQDGRILLRIEDIDSPRIKPGAAEQAFAVYEAALQKLQADERVYPCTCTRSDVERAASAPHLEHEGAAYPGTCAGRRAADASAWTGRSFAWRFRIGDRSPEFVDGFRGVTEIDLRKMGGDFVVWKSAGTPACQLAVVVDDADLGVTEVVRGDDLIPSTPRQFLLYEALDLEAPRFIHVRRGSGCGQSNEAGARRNPFAANPPEVAASLKKGRVD